MACLEIKVLLSTEDPFPRIHLTNQAGITSKHWNPDGRAIMAIARPTPSHEPTAYKPAI